MIIKLIKAKVRSGCREAFIARQRVWNDTMARQRGFLGSWVATDPEAPDDVFVAIAMRSREDLDRFMRGDHDNVERATKMPDLYDSLRITLLDVVEPEAQKVRLELTPSRAADAHQLLLLSEAYRISAVMRAAMLCGYFDALGDCGTPLEEIARRCEMLPGLVRRLTDVLGALGLVSLDGDNVVPEELARTYLRQDGAAWMGDIILHNTRPRLWHRWGSLATLLGVARGDQQEDEHQLFLNAMSNLASAGQARALISAVDLGDRRRLLDIGSGHGDYSVALRRAYPDLECVVFEQPESEEAVRSFLACHGAIEGVQVVTGNYRESLPEGPFDAVLLSNVLRGETPEAARALLNRVRGAMPRGGLLIVQDLFRDEPCGSGPLLAALFGLHLPQAMNGTEDEMVALVRECGFSDVETQPIDGYVVSNRLLSARRG